MQPIYFNGWSNLSAQATFEPSLAPSDLAAPTEGFYALKEPNYSTLFDRKSLRRWSRMTRLGLATATQALQRAGHPPIDALVHATAWGNLQDTQRFLEALVEHEEQYLSPTAFVQSTHATIAGQLAQQQQHQGYSMTYSQGPISFELALADALQLLQGPAYGTALISSADALPPDLRPIFQQLDCGPSQRPMGEGATCFLTSSQPTPHSKARLVGVALGYRTAIPARQAALKQLLALGGYSLADLDLVLAPVLPQAEDRALFGDVPWSAYGTWCGQYPTQSAFGCGLAVGALFGDPMAQHLLGGPIQRLALYQRIGERHWSLALLDQYLPTTL